MKPTTETPTSGTIQDGIHRLPLRIYYEDTDTSGIVYHARYLAFFERARTEFLRALGIEQGPMIAAVEPLAFAVKSMEIDFARPARLDDVVVVESRVVEALGASVTIAQRAMRDAQTLVTARVRVAILGADLRPRRLPRDMRRLFQATLPDD